MNRLEWILGILLVVLLVGVVALSLMFWFRADEPVAETDNLATEVASYANKVEPTSVFVGQTAQLAYAAAQQTAVSWQPDAALLNATATWPQGSTPDTLLKGEITWAMTFISPANNQMALISVIENQASMITQGALKEAVKPINVGGWNLDSSEAINRFLLEGGEAFMRNEGLTSLTMTLTADPENGRVQWLMALAASQSLRTLTMQIDATSGEIISKDQSA
jgi:hypothetical protein